LLHAYATVICVRVLPFIHTSRCAAAALIPHGQLFSVPGLPKPECMLVVDAGFSFTHIVPIMGGVVLWSAVKRFVVCRAVIYAKVTS
jgi:actin-related protein